MFPIKVFVTFQVFLFDFDLGFFFCVVFSFLDSVFE